MDGVIRGDFAEQDAALVVAETALEKLLQQLFAGSREDSGILTGMLQHPACWATVLRRAGIEIVSSDGNGYYSDQTVLAAQFFGGTTAKNGGCFR